MLELFRSAIGRIRFFFDDGKGVFRSILTLLLGSLGSKIITLGSIPFITRIYDPSDFGTLSIFTSLIFILSPIASLCYSQSIPLPRTRIEATNILALSVILIVTISLATTFLISQLHELFSDERSEATTSMWWWLVGFGVLSTSLFEALSFWATRQKAYKSLAIRSIVQAISSSVFKIIMGLFGLTSSGLLFGHIIAQSGGLMTLVKLALRTTSSRTSISRKRLRYVSKRWIQFPIWRMPSQLILVFAQQVPVISLTLLYGTSVTGQYALAAMLIAAPVEMIARSTSRVFYAESSRIGRDNPEKIRQMLRFITIRLTVIAIVPAAAVLILSPYLFTLLFGENWHDAGSYASILSLAMLFQFMQAPASYVFYIFERQKLLFLLSIQRVILVSICIMATHSVTMNPAMAIVSYSVAISLHYLATIHMAFRAIPRKSKKTCTC